MSRSTPLYRNHDVLRPTLCLQDASNTHSMQSPSYLALNRLLFSQKGHLSLPGLEAFSFKMGLNIPSLGEFLLSWADSEVFFVPILTDGLQTMAPKVGVIFFFLVLCDTGHSTQGWYYRLASLCMSNQNYSNNFLSMEAHACNSSIWKSRGRKITSSTPPWVI